MRVFSMLLMIAVWGQISTPVLAHQEGEAERPIYMTFKYYTEGPLYDRLRKEFAAGHDGEDEMLQGNPVYGVHEVDLNGDSLPELIVRFPDQYSTCNQNGCHHAVLSIGKEALTRLGYFEYAELDVAPTQTDGVQDLLVYDDPMNDFGATLYKWSGPKQEYIKY